MHIKTKATLALFAGALIWGLAFIGADIALANGWEAFPLLMCRGIIGGFALLLFSYKKQWWKNKRMMKLGFVSGLLYFVGFVCQIIGQSLSSVPNAAFLTALYILFVPLISRIFLHKKIERKVYIGCIIALIGTAILTFDSTLVLHVGDILLIACAIAFAIQIIYNEKCGEANDPLSITCIQMFTMGGLSLLFMPISGQLTLPNRAWGSVLYLALFCSALAGLLQLYGQTHVEPSKASLILCLESPLATFFSVLLLGQSMTLSILLGGGFIFTAILLVEINFNKTKKKE